MREREEGTEMEGEGTGDTIRTDDTIRTGIMIRTGTEGMTEAGASNVIRTPDLIRTESQRRGGSNDAAESMPVTEAHTLKMSSRREGMHTWHVSVYARSVHGHVALNTCAQYIAGTEM